MKTFEKVLGSVVEKMSWIAMVAIVLCMALVVSDVAKRVIIGIPVRGTFELVELIAGVILCMGIGYVTFVRGHVAVGILVDRFQPRVQAIFTLVTSIIALGSSLWLTRAMVRMALRNMERGEITGVLKIPTYPFNFVMALALSVMCVVLVRDLIKAVIIIRTGGEA